MDPRLTLEAPCEHGHMSSHALGPVVKFGTRPVCSGGEQRVFALNEELHLPDGTIVVVGEFVQAARSATSA